MKKSETVIETLRKVVAARQAAKLAELTGIPQPTITRFINGADLRLSRASKICDALGMKLVESEQIYEKGKTMMITGEMKLAILGHRKSLQTQATAVKLGYGLFTRFLRGQEGINSAAFERVRGMLKLEPTFDDRIEWDDDRFIVKARLRDQIFTCFITGDRLASGRVIRNEVEARALLNNQWPEMKGILTQRIEQKNFESPNEIIVNAEWPF